ncbi:NYN domain-containing protein [Pseudobacteroides sp.]|uniref:NYN domain-containing protein n=1 Tax=Pseudobacteroides sp. TaxID=1968840 RepID=UPI0039C970A4
MNIIVVFEGYLVKTVMKKEFFDSMTIVFTKQFDTADKLYRKICIKMRHNLF